MALRFLAIIPARAGSKGLPGKNIKNFHGKPLIAWSIESALKSQFISDVVISTDSAEIAAIGDSYKLMFPGLRDVAFSTDDASTVDAILFTYQQLVQKFKSDWDFVVILQPTSPLRSAESIDSAIEYLSRFEESSLASFNKSKSNPNWMVVKARGNRFETFLPGTDTVSRRQDLVPVYEYNGAIFIASVSLLKNRKISNDDTLFFEMSELESIDIDDALDFRIAEILFAERETFGKK